MDDSRPDPDALLAQVEQEQRPSGRGRLKIFFGAAAGVGKTYAMLSEAQERHASGVDVVVGYVATHGRKETEAVLAGLPLLPPRQVPYQGTRLEEFDLDAALARKPGLLLVDELAHTNAPDSRHARRYQDVEELLRQGIDVYTTLNVQHLDSLNDLVEQVTNVRVRETVPDSVLESADEVELIDLPPDELLARMREGKVYVPPQAQQAMANFFKKSNLTALRELALRCTADRVDEQVQVYRRVEAGQRTWPISEKVLVCISPSPSAARIVRAGRRLARRLRAEWIVLYVEQPRHSGLSDPERDFAAQALRLAEQLGAETASLAAHDAVDEIVSFARSKNVSKIVVGKPGRYWRIRDLFRGSFVGRLAHRSGDIDVYIVHGDAKESPSSPAASASAGKVDPKAYAWSVGVIALCNVAALILDRWFEASNLVMLYLLGVVFVATRWGRGPSLLAAILGVATFDFFLVPPYLSFAVSDTQYIVTFVIMALVAVVISALTVRVREQAEIARERERRTDALYSLSRELASSRSLDAMIAAVRKQVEEVYGGEAAIYLAGDAHQLEIRPGGGAPSFATDTKELAVAQWVHEHTTPAGRGTATLAGASALHLPLAGSRGSVGVLALRTPADARPLGTEAMHLLETFANQAGSALERALLARETHRQKLAAEGERLRNALLAAVSHDLRTPLAAIAGAASSLASSEARLDADARRDLVLTILEESGRMNRLANNLLDMGRVQTPGVALRKDWLPIEEVIGSALEQLELPLRGREVAIHVPQGFPLVPIDDVLVERVLVNLLENALRYTPPGSAIELSATAAPGEAIVEVLDRGPGIPPGEEERIFDKFHRGTSARSARGIGLGLAVARAIVEAHGGTIRAANRPDGGAVFRFTLPLAGEPPQSEPGVEA
jgi:two-component system sensor histidine kinase KdpD